MPFLRNDGLQYGKLHTGNFLSEHIVVTVQAPSESIAAWILTVITSTEPKAFQTNMQKLLFEPASCAASLCIQAIPEEARGVRHE